jgi:hypothetical protein
MLCRVGFSIRFKICMDWLVNKKYPNDLTGAFNCTIIVVAADNKWILFYCLHNICISCNAMQMSYIDNFFSTLLNFQTSYKRTKKMWYYHIIVCNSVKQILSYMTCTHLHAIEITSMLSQTELNPWCILLSSRRILYDTIASKTNLSAITYFNTRLQVYLIVQMMLYPKQRF